jgi:hypothetical protein
MANVRYLLGRAFSPAVSLKMDCSRTETTPADVLTALGMMGEILPGFSGLVSAMLHVKWGRDFTSLPELEREVFRFSMWHFGRKRWAVYDREKYTSAETMHMFAEQVMTEFYDGVCHTCHGRGTTPNQNGVVTICQTCKGTSRDIVTGRSRARALRLDEQNVRATWGQRLDFVLSEMNEIERRALSKINYKIEG